MSGPIAKQTCLTGYGTMAERLRTTLLKSLVPNGPLKQQQTGKQLAKEANVKQAVISWLQHFKQMSFTVQCEPCCNGGTMPVSMVLNPLTPNDRYSGRTAPLTSKCCILYIYSTNKRTEYF